MEEYREAQQLDGSDFDELAKAVSVARVLVEEVEKDPGLSAGQLFVLQILHLMAISHSKTQRAAETGSA